MKIWRKFLMLIIGMLFSVSAQTHPYHVSIAELKYNDRTQAFELAIKVFTDDLEKTLSLSAKKPVVIKQSQEISRQLDAYLKKKIWLEDEKGKLFQQHFIGFEAEGDAQWLYLEIPVKTGQLGQVKMGNKLLSEMHADQMNLVNMEIKGQKKTLVFKDGAVLQSLQ